MSLNFLDKNEKCLLALYLKRMTYEDAYRRADATTNENQRAMAYRILDVLGKVQDELAKEGFAPR